MAPFNSYPDGLRILWDCQAESVSSLLRYGNTSLEMYSQITCRNLGRSNAVYQSSRYLSGSYQHHNFGFRRIGLWFRFLEPFGHNSSPCIGYSKSVACTRWRCTAFEQEQSARHSDDSNTWTDHLSICARVRGLWNIRSNGSLGRGVDTLNGISFPAAGRRLHCMSGKVLAVEAFPRTSKISWWHRRVQ